MGEQGAEPEWIEPAVAVAIHEAQIGEHGGAVGIRDEGLLQSALARPRHLFSFGEPDLADLAASYAFGIARNHPFIDGNKRTAFVLLELFLALNGMSLIADDAECVAAMLALAAGELEEDVLAAWIRERSRPR